MQVISVVRKLTKGDNITVNFNNGPNGLSGNTVRGDFVRFLGWLLKKE